MKMMKKQKMLNIMNKTIIDLPSPSTINSMWNFGSLIGLCLMIQIMTGLFLSMHYCSNIDMAFDSIMHICRNVNMGWMMRNIHANMASMFFICMYMHVSRGMYYSLFLNKMTWVMGVIILLTTMMTAFVGYVLPWGQMSFWGATVITNLLSAIPYMGMDLVQWVWGGFAIDNATLSRFFSLHFIMPFMIMMMSVLHLMFLHETGSKNPMGINSNNDMIPFHPYFSTKDTVGFLILMMITMMLTLFNPYMMMDPDNFTQANPLVTPNHIKPEWYFLFAYSILRSIPNKLGGVIALFMSIMMLMTMIMYKKKIQSNSFYPMNKIMFWVFVMTFIMLTIMGMKPVKEPFTSTSQALTVMYFSFFIVNNMMTKKWDNIMFKN
uniref:Cytochrome b n=1 Tax=Stenocladius sp. FM17 TaxID=2596692 RepID=A0A5C0PXB6_9COLE|nr:cytochrome b [Stenocladius sp. FM17]